MDNRWIAAVESPEFQFSEGGGYFTNKVSLRLGQGQEVAVQSLQWDAIAQKRPNFNGGLAKPFYRRFRHTGLKVKSWVSKYIP